MIDEVEYTAKANFNNFNITEESEQLDDIQICFDGKNCKKVEEMSEFIENEDFVAIIKVLDKSSNITLKSKDTKIDISVQGDLFPLVWKAYSKEKFFLACKLTILLGNDTHELMVQGKTSFEELMEMDKDGNPFDGSFLSEFEEVSFSRKGWK